MRAVSKILLPVEGFLPGDDGCSHRRDWNIDSRNKSLMVFMDIYTRLLSKCATILNRVQLS